MKWGLMRVQKVYENFVTNMIGILSGITFTISLFATQVPKEAGWLRVSNNPVFIFIFAVIMIGISILAGKFSAYWDKNSAFGVDGLLGRSARGKMGSYASLDVCVTTLITGFIYVFTCLKAWAVHLM